MFSDGDEDSNDLEYNESILHDALRAPSALCSTAMLRGQLREEYRSTFFPASSEKDSDFMYCRFLGGECLEPRGPSMTAAVDLLYLLQMGVCRKDEMLLQEASRLYEITTANLKIDLQSQNAAQNDGMLAAIWILHFADSFSPTRGNANSTHLHKQAAEQIMISRGPYADFSPLAQILLYNIRLTGTSFGMINRKPVPSAGHQWASSAAWAGSIESELIKLLLEIPALLHDFDCLVEQSRNPRWQDLYAVLKEFTRVEEELNTWLIPWMRTISGEIFHYTPASTFTHLMNLTNGVDQVFPSVIEYPSFAVASLQMSYCTGLMQVKQSILELLEMIKDVSLLRIRRHALLEDLDQCADLLCKSAAFTTQPKYGYCGIMRSLGPIYFAAKWFHHQQQWDKLRWAHVFTAAVQETHQFDSPYNLPLGPSHGYQSIVIGLDGV